MLIEKGLDVDAKNDARETPLHKAVSNNNHKIAKLILEKGANPNISDNEKNSPLHLAVQFADIKMAQLLLDNKANQKLTNKNGWTQLHLAAYQNKFEMIKFLVNHMKITIQKINDMSLSKRLEYICSIDPIFKKRAEAFLKSLKQHKNKYYFNNVYRFRESLLLQSWYKENQNTELAKIWFEDPHHVLTAWINVKNNDGNSAWDLANKQGKKLIELSLKN